MYNLVTQKILEEKKNRPFVCTNYSSRDNYNQMDMLANMSFDYSNNRADDKDNNN